MAAEETTDAESDPDAPILSSRAVSMRGENERKVITPATEVRNVEARVAGATSEGGRPQPTRIGARIEPPPIP